ncbi:hypothetical protein N8T08_000485 [Aspergillus melleus]|uniref:Uncharacterized protein n=1 Tax=Aspergillus melleus TaxID=138277 RepID=A0ACC3BC67_9EURO|nr:hypothetical protein N8T08_000485 [Aspergillus melleus]
MFPFIRNIKTIRYLRSVANLSIFCRGKPITRSDLFTYTNGRFLINEEDQFARRYQEFNIDALCDVAATAPAGGSVSPITTIEKLEGGFSKALLMTKENGDEIVAKIPYRIAGPPVLTTGTEVGVLEFPWSSDISNPVEAEYIIMGKAPGIQLYELWGEMAEIEKLELIKSLTQLERQFSGIEFPAYGGLYLRWDAERFGFRRWKCLSDFGISIVQRQFSLLAKQTPDNQSLIQHETPEEQARLLEATIALMRMLDSHPILSQFSQPTLWHTDLHMGNIFISPDNKSLITSLIDIQSLSIRPLFLQTQWPIFIHPPRNYPQGLIQPTLPQNFNNLDPDEQALALHQRDLSKMSKAYEVSTFLENRPAYHAMYVPRVFRELFIRAGDVSTVGIVPLRGCLIEIFRNWSYLGMTGQCPYSFSPEETSAHGEQFERYTKWNEAQQLAMEALDTDADGWISPHVDFELRRRQNRELLEMYIERMAGQMSSEEVRRMWPFPE